MSPAKKTTKTSAKTKSAPKSASSAKTKTAPKAAPKPKAPRVTDTAPANTGGGGSWWGWVVAVLLGGALFGALTSDLMWVEEFDEDSSMVVIEGTTWMPVGGTPVTVVVLNDKTCGAACDTRGGLDSLRASVSPALKVKELDVSSPEGQALVQQFDVTGVPQYFFGEDIEDFMVAGPNGEELRFIENLPEGIVVPKGDLYFINGGRAGLKPGKFIKAPDWADADTEPKLGNGTIPVVEFTNYQCGYCKRFHDQNKDLIARLVAEGKITYMVKDFPMFNANDRFAHRAANCVLQSGGQDAYWQMNAAIFAAQGEWSKIEGAEGYFNTMAQNLGHDISTCVNESVIAAEIQADMAEGSGYGVTGTPAVFVGTQILPGAVGPAVVEAAVNAELAK